MITIGLLGGVASGKSLVAEMLRELGAGTLDADRAGHQVLEEPGVKEALREHWGEDFFAADGSVDRAAVAARVFCVDADGSANRRFLEALLHPRIRARLRQQAEQLADQGIQVVVLDAPLLLEAGWEADCDVLLLIDSPRPLRLARARRRGWTEDQFIEREAAQMEVAAKRERADFIVKNDGHVEELRRQVEQFWTQSVAPRL